MSAHLRSTSPCKVTKLHLTTLENEVKNSDQQFHWTYSFQGLKSHTQLTALTSGSKDSISIIWNLLRDSTVLEVRWCCFHMDFSNLFPGNCVWREAGISLHAFLPRGSLPPRLSVKPPFLPQEVRGSHLCGKSGDRAHGVCLQAFSCPGGLRAEVTRAR